MRRKPTNLERNFLPGRDGELGCGMKVLAAKLDRGTQAEGVGAGDGDDTVIGPSHPRNDRTVIEANRQRHFHRHFAALTDHLAQDIMRLRRGRHAVDERDGTGFCFKSCFQDEGVFPVAPMDLLDRAVGRYQPVAVFIGAEERGEASGGIETGKAEPIYGTLARN
jgi:hypothetical protein